MLLDINAYVGHWPFKQLKYNTCGMLLDRMNKFAFGTHSPILDYLTGRLRIESMNEAEADEPTKEMLRSDNAKRILGISH
jgi:hypothetical protein